MITQTLRANVIAAFMHMAANVCDICQTHVPYLVYGIMDFFSATETFNQTGIKKIRRHRFQHWLSKSVL